MLIRLSGLLLVLALVVFSCLEIEQTKGILWESGPQVVRAVALPVSNELLADCVYLPENSIVETAGGQHLVWVQRGGVAAAQLVKLGEMLGDLRQVCGLEAGEIVILESQVKADTPIFTQIINHSASSEAGMSGSPSQR